MKTYRLSEARLSIVGNKLYLIGKFEFGDAVVQTSRLKLLDIERGYAITQNSIYQFDRFMGE